jgi:triacylglycerol lipase
MNHSFESKPIPLITWRNMAPPFTHHRYFQHYTAFPFESRSERFSRVNAWWLSEAALLAYCPEEFARPRFEAAGFDQLWFFSDYSTQCYVAAARDTAVVAFRGTECGLDQGPEALSQFIADLSVNLDIRWVDAQGGGRIHRGFRDGLDEVWMDLRACLEKLASRGCTLWVTGHSLGGALALLAAARIDRFSEVQGVYVFGAPRIGDQRFAEGYAPRVYRFLNNNDVVPHIPPFPYSDLGELRYIDASGNLHERISRWQRWMDEIQGHIQCLMENLHHLKDDMSASLPDGIKDHTPLLYALHIWNNLVRTCQE